MFLDRVNTYGCRRPAVFKSACVWSPYAVHSPSRTRHAKLRRIPRTFVRVHVFSVRAGNFSAAPRCGRSRSNAPIYSHPPRIPGGIRQFPRHLRLLRDSRCLYMRHSSGRRGNRRAFRRALALGVPSYAYLVRSITAAVLLFLRCQPPSRACFPRAIFRRTRCRRNVGDSVGCAACNLASLRCWLSGVT